MRLCHDAGMKTKSSRLKNGPPAPAGDSRIMATDEWPAARQRASEVRNILEQIIPLIRQGKTIRISLDGVRVKHLAPHLVRGARKLGVEITTRRSGEFLYVKMVMG